MVMFLHPRREYVNVQLEFRSRDRNHGRRGTTDRRMIDDEFECAMAMRFAAKAIHQANMSTSATPTN